MLRGASTEKKKGGRREGRRGMVSLERKGRKERRELVKKNEGKEEGLTP